MKPETLIAMAAGAFVFWMHSRVKAVEEAVSGGVQIKIGAVLDTPEDAPEPESSFGFRPTKKREHVR